jgi:16S rRNA processing protein RimM
VADAGERAADVSATAGAGTGESAGAAAGTNPAADEPTGATVGEAGGGPAAVPLDVGRVGRAHGLDGSFYVIVAHPLRPRLLDEGGVVTVAGGTRRIVRRAGVEQRPILRLDGIEDRSAAEALRGEQLTVALERAPALGAGEWWAHELKGCAVLDGARRVGSVSGLLALPSCEVLEVRCEDGRELLVPMVRDAVRHVDVPARRIEVSLDFLGEA